MRNQKLLKMKLEEQIDGQVDKKIKLKQDTTRARKQIARTIRKSQTYLLDAEKLLRSKLTAVNSLRTELDRLSRE